MSTDHKNSDFNNDEEALDFLIQRSRERKQKKHFQELFDTAKSSTTKTSVVPVRTKLFRLVGAVAAISVGFIIAFTFLNQGEDAQLFATNMIQQTIIDTPNETRGGESNSLEIDDQIKNALDNLNYKSAVTLFTSKADQLTTSDSFFYAVSLMKTERKEYDKIDELLAESIITKNEFYSESLWLSALNDIHNGQKEDAVEKLNSLKSLNYQSKNVNVLLKILED